MLLQLLISNFKVIIADSTRLYLSDGEGEKGEVEKRREKGRRESLIGIIVGELSQENTVALSNCLKASS